jgi:hypothetical protein
MYVDGILTVVRACPETQLDYSNYVQPSHTFVPQTKILAGLNEYFNWYVKTYATGGLNQIRIPKNSL